MEKIQLYSKKIYKNIKKYVQIDACEDCPFFAGIENWKDEYYRYLVNGVCDLANKEIHIISVAYPRWCPLDKKMMMKDEDWEEFLEDCYGEDTIHSLFT